MGGRGRGARYSLCSPAGATVMVFASPHLWSNGGHVHGILPCGKRTRLHETDILFLLGRGWTLHATYGRVTHQLSNGTMSVPKSSQAPRYSEAAPKLQTGGATWRVCVSAEAVAREFGTFRRPQDVAHTLGISREAVYSHLTRLSVDHEIYRRKRGFIEIRVAPKVRDAEHSHQRTASQVGMPYARSISLADHLKRLPPGALAI